MQCEGHSRNPPQTQEVSYEAIQHAQGGARYRRAGRGRCGGRHCRCRGRAEQLRQRGKHAAGHEQHSQHEHRSKYGHQPIGPLAELLNAESSLPAHGLWLGFWRGPRLTFGFLLGWRTIGDLPVEPADANSTSRPGYPRARSSAAGTAGTWSGASTGVRTGVRALDGLPSSCAACLPSEAGPYTGACRVGLADKIALASV
jgi:hypothetical protein